MDCRQLSLALLSPANSLSPYFVDGSIVVQTVRDGKGAFCYNVATGEYVDMLKAGIIDPTKVTRSALQNAASIAGLLLVTEAMVADIPKKDSPPPPSPGGMDGMY